MKYDMTLSLDILRRTPAVLHAMLHGIDDAWSLPNEGGDTFSVFDNVGHMIEGEERDWPNRARIILGDGPDRRFQKFDREAHRTRNVGRTLDSLLEEFADLRAANVRLLEEWQLTTTHLARTGEHPVFGTVTLQQLLATWVVHDLGHIAQISRVMAKQYRDAVGPWIAYLPVVTDRPVPAS